MDLILCGRHPDCAVFFVKSGVGKTAVTDSDTNAFSCQDADRSFASVRCQRKDFLISCLREALTKQPELDHLKTLPLGFGGEFLLHSRKPDGGPSPG
jgi:hypothetical protein